MISFLTDITVDGVALWVVLLICVGVFLGAFMDAIACFKWQLDKLVHL